MHKLALNEKFPKFCKSTLRKKEGRFLIYLLQVSIKCKPCSKLENNDIMSFALRP